jgi:mannose-1-phosphate guanylyltransferase
MLEPDLYLVVIAGGNGTRFWPKSTSKRPKQLLAFNSTSPTSTIQPNLSLLAQTLHRFDQLVPFENRFILTTEALKEVVELENLDAQLLAEPQGRNTAPCVYWAAKHIAAKNPKGLILVMPSDHYIANPEKFISTLRSGIQWAREKDDLVTLGIRPTRPETGYGYLKLGDLVESSVPLQCPHRVDSFVEKPNLDRAMQFLESKSYLWNGGMFVWRAEVILKAFDQYMPEMKQAWESSNGVIEEAYPLMTATSIDYGVMEKAKNVVTFPLDCGWDDLGSWTSLESIADILNARIGENTVTGGQLLAIDSNSNIIDVPNRLVALLGVQDLIVVEHGDALLVAHKSKSQDIRKVVDEVKKHRPELA